MSESSRGPLRHFTCVGAYERCQAACMEPDRYRALLALPANKPVIAMGAGLSLAGAGFSPDALTVDMRHFNRILDLDQNGMTLHVEAGATLASLFPFLADRGLMIAVQPGHPGITIGGCIAGNIHGKNQYRIGTFADLVEGIRLFHPAHGILDLDRQRHADVFELTVGGCGLTGILLSARIRLHPEAGRSCLVRHTPVAGMQEAVQQMKGQQQHEDFMYSWHDVTPFGGSSGKGFLVSGRFVSGTHERNGWRNHPPLNHASPWPLPVFNGLTLPIINGIYRRLKQGYAGTEDLFTSLFPFAIMPSYFHAYGPRGFIEHQVLIPDAHIIDYLERFLALAHDFRQSFGMVSLKRFRGERKLLRYSGDGFSVGLHLPATPKAIRFLAQLDEIDTQFNGIANIIKDSRLSASVVAAQFPEYVQFRERLATFDPGRIFTSMLSRRLAL
ncbi:MAG: FAD-binding oxidoreductase [Magnetococcales bacterium]|nr:FAD-binding oxidoreductase [Magnetococcales bacterium]